VTTPDSSANTPIFPPASEEDQSQAISAGQSQDVSADQSQDVSADISEESQPQEAAAGQLKEPHEAKSMSVWQPLIQCF